MPITSGLRRLAVIAVAVLPFGFLVGPAPANADACGLQVVVGVAERVVGPETLRAICSNRPSAATGCAARPPPSTFGFGRDPSA
jgi:hypothetical protein